MNTNQRSRMDEICVRLTGSMHLMNLLYESMLHRYLDAASYAEITYAIYDYTGIALENLILLSDEL